MNVKEITKPVFKQLIHDNHNMFNMSEAISQSVYQAKKTDMKYYAFFEEDTLVGLCGIDTKSSDYDNRTELVFLEVRKDSRRKGYGSQMLTWVEEHYLNFVLNSSVDYINFYLNRGLKRTVEGSYILYYGKY